jgi:hypothetical protein
LEEKLCILKAKGNKSVNTWSEFYAKCCQKEKFSACKFKPMTQDKPPRQRPTVDVDESNIHWLNLNVRTQYHHASSLTNSHVIIQEFFYRDLNIRAIYTSENEPRPK